MFQSKNFVFSISCFRNRTFCFFITFLALVAVTIPSIANSQSTTSHGFSSIRALSLGNTGVAHIGVESIFDNQAAAAFLDKTGVIAGAKSSFTLADLNQYGAGASIKLTNSAAGIELNSNGSDDYSERKIGVFYARSLSKKIAIAGQMNYFGLAISEHGQASALSFEVAAISKISDQINVGIHLYSPIEVKFADAISLPSIFTAGVEYLVADDLRLSAELEKDLNQAESIQMGIEYSPLEALFVRLGFRTNPTEFSFGVGLKLKSNLNIDIGSHWHQVLGFSPGLGLSYRFTKRPLDDEAE